MAVRELITADLVASLAQELRLSVATMAAASERLRDCRPASSAWESALADEITALARRVAEAVQQPSSPPSSVPATVAV